MKIWMFIRNDCRHEARALREAKTLAEAGHDVGIIGILGQDTEPYEERDGFRILRVAVPGTGVKPAPPEGRPSSPALLRRLRTRVGRFLVVFPYYRRAWSIVRSSPGNVYHCHDLDTLPLGYMARRRCGGKLVYDARELYTGLAYISGPAKWGWGVVERFLIRRADEVITTGTYRAEYLGKRYGIAVPTVIGNYPSMAAAPAPNRALREKVGLTDDTVPVVLYQGIFMAGRGLDKLVLAATYLDKGVVVLMGWGTLEGDLRRLVEEEGLSDRVYFSGPAAPEQVVYYCMSASVGVVIYRYTSLNNYYATPNKLYEYIQAGLPVVSSDFPALKDIVDGYGLGSTFDPEEPESIAAAINRVLTDQQQYNTMKMKALEAAKIFNWENESRKLLEIYGRLP